MKNIGLLLFMSFMLLCVGESVHACSCPKFGPALTREQEIKKILERGETAVFSGEVISIRDITDQEYFRDITFKVDRYWNGTVTREFTVRSFQADSGCTFDFRIGTSYLMFTYVYQNGVYTDECYGIYELKTAEEDIKHLGMGKIPVVKKPKDQ